MELSLVIPAHNEEKYVGECLRRVFAVAPGTFKEIIVVDNASTDKTAEIARAFPGVTVVAESRKGTNFARERGWRATSAPLVAFIDADVHLKNGWVEKVKRAFARNPRLVCLTGPYWYYDLPWTLAAFIWINWHFALIGHFFTHGMGVTGNMVLARDALERMNGFDTSFTFSGDDVDTALRAKRLGHVRFTFSIILDSSGRRYKKLGVLCTLWLYIRNTIAQHSGLFALETDENLTSAVR